MSLMSLITTGTNMTSSSSASSTKAGAIKAAVAAATASGAPATTAAGSAGNGVTISAAAQIAAAEAVDNKKDFSVLTADVRKALDEQYAGGAKTPGLGEMSGRALAAIALNKGGGFSAKEVAAAKAELKDRTRAQFSAAIAGSATMNGIAAYNQQLVSQYDSMSAEEREALGWTDKVRASAAAFVGTSTKSSLFDQLGDIGLSDDGIGYF